MTQTPGIYIAEQDAFPNGIVGVPTAVPAFIGYTEKATSPDGTDVTRTLVRITSFAEYEQHFGTAPPQQVSIDVEHHVDQAGATRGVRVAWTTPLGAPSSVLPYALQLFFANGGGPCLIYSLGAPTTPSLHDFTSAVTALEASPAPTLLLFPDAMHLAPADYAALVAAALASAGRTQDRFVIADVPESSHNLATLASDFRASLVTVNPGDRRYGAAYLPYVETTLPLHTTAGSVTINAFTSVVLDGKGAISARTSVPEMSNRRLADIPATTPSYSPNVQLAITNFLAQATVTLPPSAAIVGVYAMMDTTRGVWKAPANVSLAAVRKPTVAMTTEQQGELNVDATHGFSLNAIREFIGQGTLVWGARTLDGNSSDWRYVSVRRFVTFVEQSIKLGLQPLVFERNDAATWTGVNLLISNFLTGLWRSGALAGSTPRDAFAVHVGLGSTMTAQDVAEGRMRVEIMLAVVRPAEFHVITLEQMMGGGT